MNKLISVALLVSGVLALAYGVTASNSVGSDFSRLFTGAPTEKSIWLLLAGGIAVALGGGGLVTASKSS
jgi:hypothetical protein